MFMRVFGVLIFSGEKSAPGYVLVISSIFLYVILDFSNFFLGLINITMSCSDEHGTNYVATVQV